MNIRTIGNNSNYRLLGKKVSLDCRVLKGYRPDGDGYEPVWDEYTESEKSKQLMRVRGARKQRAAKAVSPKVSIVDVKPLNPVPYEVGVAIYEGKTEDEIKIAQLEAQIRKLMGVYQVQEKRKERLVETKQQLEQKFAARKL
jgi:hypothetical protein